MWPRCIPLAQALRGSELVGSRDCRLRLLLMLPLLVPGSDPAVREARRGGDGGNRDS